MTVVSMNYLLEAGVHFGHQKRRWNPKMKEYIYTSRDDIYIIDLKKTAQLIEEAYAEIKKIAEANGTFLFVGTKKQANEAMEESAKRTGMYYVTNRWLGGTLTNFRTIRSRIKRLEEIEKMEEDKTMELLPKKEVFKIRKEYDKLNANLAGIREMKKLPSALIIVDPRVEETAIKEARKLHIPVFGIVDTNCDPDMVDYVIPANDDAVRAVKLVIGVLANAIAEVKGGEMVNYVLPEDKKAPKEHVEKQFEEKFVKEVSTERVVNKDERRDNRKEKRNFKENHQAVKKENVKEEKTPVEEKTASVEVEEKSTIKDSSVSEKASEVEEKSFDSMTLAELKTKAKEKGIKGYSTMKKAELIESLK